MDILRSKIRAKLERYPDEAVERYCGFREDKYYGIEIRRRSATDALKRYPGTVSHLICHSLGYCTPLFAAGLVLAAARNEADWCEWIFSCYRSDPWPALCDAIAQRRSHRGYMADIQQARGLVESVRRRPRTAPGKLVLAGCDISCYSTTADRAGPTFSDRNEGDAGAVCASIDAIRVAITRSAANADANAMGRITESAKSRPVRIAAGWVSP